MQYKNWRFFVHLQVIMNEFPKNIFDSIVNAS